MVEPNFYASVFEVTRLIPKGRVTSFGAIGAYLGAKRSSRMVGYALKLALQVSPPVPAHRVVNRQGLLSGRHHFGGNVMQELLEKEGIVVEDNQVKDFEKLFWDPGIELL